MKLYRNRHEDGLGKYVLHRIKRPVTGLQTLEEIDGRPGSEGEYFVLMLKDRHSLPALIAYAESIGEVDPEFAEEVLELAARAGDNSKFCKEPD